MANYGKSIVAFSAVASIMSFCLAIIYYQVFFAHFPHLSPKILTTADYFDKVADLAPSVLFSSMLIIWINLKNWDPGTSESIEYENKTRLFIVGVSIGFTLFLLVTFTLIKSSWITFFICLAIGAISIFFQTLPLKDLKLKFQIPLSNSIVIIVSVLIIIVVISADQDVKTIRDAKYHHLDTIENGLISSENNRLIFTLKNGTRFESSFDPAAEPMGCLISKKKSVVFINVARKAAQCPRV